MKLTNTAKYTIGALIALFTMNITTDLGDPLFARDSPERCSPYPLCKLLDEEKIQGDTSIRLLEPVEKLETKEVIEQITNTEKELTIEKQQELEK